MTPKHFKVESLITSISLILLPNVIFFIWRGSNDTLISYQHLMINAILLASGLTLAFIFSTLNTKKSLVFSIIDLWPTLFLLLILLNLKDGYESLITDKKLLTFLLGLGIYAVVRLYSSQLNNENTIVVIFVMLMAIEVGFLTVEFIQLFYIQLTKFPAFKGSFDNSGKLGIYLSLLYPCLLYLFIRKTSLAHKSILIAGTIVFLLFLILSFSRIAWVSAFVCSVILTSWYLKSKTDKRIFYLLIGIVLIVLTVAILVIKHDSASGRLLVWNITSRHLGDHWLIGAGYGKFPALYNLWQSDYFSHRELTDKYFYIADNTYFAFNEFLQTGIELGVSGIFIWAILTTYVVYWSFKGSVWALSICAFLITGLASYPFRETQHQIIFFIFLALFANNQSRSNNFSIFNSNNFLIRISSKFLFIIPVTIFSVLVVFCFRQYQAIPAWKMAREEFSFDEKQALRLYEKANKRLKFNAEFLLEYGTQLAEVDSISTAKGHLKNQKYHL